MDFDKTDLVNGNLEIQNTDGTTTHIPQARCAFDANAQALFDEFTAVYPNGKPQPNPAPGEPIPIPTETELLQQQLKETNAQIANQDERLKLMENDVVAFQDYVLNTIGGV